MDETSDPKEPAMPRYRCHKEVSALKIGSIGHASGDSCTLFPEDDSFSPIEVGAKFFDRHLPQPGGYFVVYADGYRSYSPAGPFEEGYTRI